MTYSEKLKDPRWQKLRLLILQRDCWACVNCGKSTKTLHVHHWVYSKNPWEADPETLMSLCEDCHAKATVMSKELEEKISMFCNDANHDKMPLDQLSKIISVLDVLSSNTYPEFFNGVVGMEILNEIIETMKMHSYNRGFNKCEKLKEIKK